MCLADETTIGLTIQNTVFWNGIGINLLFNILRWRQYVLLKGN
jgi:hypothetical protein